tara:strand:+ start:160 stop:708 length:549 start_codon:yes stop_codon:yes gene_type:complete
MDHLLQQSAGPVCGQNTAFICVQFIKQLYVFNIKCQPVISVSVGTEVNYAGFYRGKISHAAQPAFYGVVSTQAHRRSSLVTLLPDFLPKTQKTCPIGQVFRVQSNSFRQIRSEGVRPFIDFLLGFIFGLAVAFLDLASELILFAGNDVKIVIGEFAPLFLCLALELTPFAFNNIPVHVIHLS